MKSVYLEPSDFFVLCFFSFLNSLKKNKMKVSRVYDV